jgi:short-subunit dehydrogenase
MKGIYIMNLENKTIVVTGAGNGMGRAITLALVEKGARVAAVDINELFLNATVELAGEKGAKISTHVVDITNREAVLALPALVVEAHGNVDGLINNAGIIQSFERISDMDFAAIERVMDINFWGMVNMTKAFLPYLSVRPEAYIVNISSMGGFLPVPGQTVYGASKAAVKLFTEGLRAELLETNVGVSVVFPGAISTRIKQNSNINEEIDENADKNKENKITSPEKAAEIILNSIEKKKYQVRIGMDSKAMDLVCKVAPKFAASLMATQMKAHLPK